MEKNEIDDLFTKDTLILKDDKEEVESKGKKKKKAHKKEKRKLSFGKKLLIIFSVFFLTGIGSLAFLLYGPWDGFRNFWITSAMTTMTHQYLATIFYSNETIQKVLEKNKIIEASGKSNPDLIEFKEYTGKHIIYASKFEEQILKKDEGNDLYKVIEVAGKGYQGYLVAIYDASRVHIATTQYLRSTGEFITKVAERENAIIAMNAGGFYDPDWNSNGALPHGTVIQDGKVVSDYKDANMAGGMVGFTRDNKLLLGRYSAEEAISVGYRDAVEFGPYLIVNGKSSFVRGNGGWGIAPRTAIGQRSDGIVLFLVINGRLASSIGADMGDLTEVMENYGAINAANMDGGSSSELVINHQIINHPVAAGPNGLRMQPTFWIVK